MAYVDITYQTQEEFLDMVLSLTKNCKVQVQASSYNPVGLLGEMQPVSHGISLALKAPGNSDSIMVVNIAVHERADLTKEAYAIHGWSAGDVGDVEWKLEILHVAEGTDTTAAADHTILVTDTVTVANGYHYTIFTIPAAGVGTRMCKMNLVRNGISDTNSGDAKIEGILVAFQPMGKPEE